MIHTHTHWNPPGRLAVSPTVPAPLPVAPDPGEPISLSLSLSLLYVHTVGSCLSLLWRNAKLVCRSLTTSPALPSLLRQVEESSRPGVELSLSILPPKPPAFQSRSSARDCESGCRHNLWTAHRHLYCEVSPPGCHDTSLASSTVIIPCFSDGACQLQLP